MPEGTEIPLLTQPDAENSGYLSHRPKSRGVLAFALVAALWVGFGFGLRPAWAVCTAWFTANGISFVNGEQAANAANSNYDYWNYCKTLSLTTGVYVNPSTLTWNLTSEAQQYKQSWVCTYQGRNDTYFPVNCSWGSNITAFWESPAQQTNSVLILR